MPIANKGKACIIAISEFEAGLPPLNGYYIDALQLTDLWTKLGFDLTLPKSDSDGSNNLTAQVQTIIDVIDFLLHLGPSMYNKFGICNL